MVSRKPTLLPVLLLIIKGYFVHSQCNQGSWNGGSTTAPSSFIPCGQFVIPAVIKPLIQSNEGMPSMPTPPRVPTLGKSTAYGSMPPIIYNDKEDEDDLTQLLYLLLFSALKKKGGLFGNDCNNGCGRNCNGCGCRCNCGCGGYNCGCRGNCGCCYCDNWMYPNFNPGFNGGLNGGFNSGFNGGFNEGFNGGNIGNKVNGPFNGGFNGGFGPFGFGPFIPYPVPVPVPGDIPALPSNDNTQSNNAPAQINLIVSTSDSPSSAQD